MRTVPPTASPFASACERYHDNGLCVIPIAPGSKRPGEYSSGNWHGMTGWNKFFARMPYDKELEVWSNWPGAGIGLVCGQISRIVAVDIDTDDKFILRALSEVMPPSPVRKRGRKGFTAFYRYGNQVSQSWDVKKERIVDLLSDGRQTVMPGTAHPSGGTYVYTTEDTLDSYDIELLPELPKDFSARLDRVLGVMQTPDDRAARRAPRAEIKEDANTRLYESIASKLWGEINEQALQRLDEWVPSLVPGAKPETKGGYRCRAFWRNAANPNVGIHPSGIRDFGGNYGLSPIDLVMYAGNVTFSQASEMLRQVLGIGSETITLTVNGKEAIPDVEKPAGNPEEITRGIMDQVRARPVIPMPVAMPRPDADPMVAAVLEQQQARAEEEAARESVDLPEFIVNAPGMIGAIADWINNTAAKPQPEFAVAAALTIGATIMGRRYRTNQRNFSSLYFVLVAKSGEGKDHPQKCVKKVLIRAGLGGLIGGSGYTSQGAVFTELMRSPSHLSIIDEIGQMLKASIQKGGSQLDAALSELLKAFSSCDDQMTAPTYSKMGLSKEQRKAVEQRPIYNPAISMLGATTPELFYSVCGEAHVEGGFMGRLILVQTNLPRRESAYPPEQEPPESVIAWCKELVEESMCDGDIAGLMNPDMEANPKAMFFDDECQKLLLEFEREIMRKQDAIENTADDRLLARTREKAMRISMIVAKATNRRGDNIITGDALRWAIAYVKHYDYITVSVVANKRPQPKIEEQLKRAMEIIKRAAKYQDKAYLHVTKHGVMPHSLLLQKMKLDHREFANLITTGIESGRITKADGYPDAKFAGVVYFIRGEPDA